MQEILDRIEWEEFECKRAETKPKDLLKTVIAMANKNGGTLVIGLEDPGKAERSDRLLGINSDRENVSNFLTDLRALRSVETETPEIDIENVNGYKDTLLVVQIKKGCEIQTHEDGKTYVRSGSRNKSITAQEIIKMQQDRGGVKFEDGISKISQFDEIDKKLLGEYREEVGSVGGDGWQFLRNSGLAKDKDGIPHFTEAGVLLFGNDPAITLKKKCEIKISHYRGTSREYSNSPNFVAKPITIGGNLITQIMKAVEHFQYIVKKGSPVVLKGGFFQSFFSIPEFVFQEAIANAVIHRNYLLEDDIQVRFFDDRIEVESPGTYPGNITPSNILRDRFSRNSIIQRVLNKFPSPPNADVGEGVDRMFAEMKASNLYDPYYTPPSKSPYTVLLVLYTTPRHKYWDRISKYLDECYTITNGDARDIVNEESSTTMSRLLKGWGEMGLLERRGPPKKGGYYKKPGVEVPKGILTLEK